MGFTARRIVSVVLATQIWYTLCPAISCTMRKRAKKSYRRVNKLTPVFVDFIPEHPEAGRLYISRQYRTATHLCCCGCGNKVVTPLKKDFWSLREHGNRVWLSPSIGNWSLKCRSHYYIRGNRIEWLGEDRTISWFVRICRFVQYLFRRMKVCP